HFDNEPNSTKAGVGGFSNIVTREDGGPGRGAPHRPDLSAGTGGDAARKRGPLFAARILPPRPPPPEPPNIQCAPATFSCPISSVIPALASAPSAKCVGSAMA